MERTQIYLDTNQKEKLQQLASDSGKTMAELIREAVEQYITKGSEISEGKLLETGGIWKDRSDIVNSGEYVADMRRNWNKRMEETK